MGTQVVKPVSFSYILKGLFLFFQSKPYPDKVAIISVFILCINAFNNLLICPIAFNYFIIPNIEKKLGKKLQFPFYYDFYLFGNYIFKSTNIMAFMMKRYIMLKVNPNFKFHHKHSPLALARVNYDISKATRFEIFMSFFGGINYLVFVISAIVFTRVYSQVT